MPPLNPWHRDHWSGASSSGSGVATAAGLCFGSLGTDTGGSIRFPSAANGNTGLKPTWGRVSRHGCFELAASLDHIGPMCRSATDAAIMLGAIAGADPNDPTARLDPVPDYLAAADGDLRGMRIGFDDRYALDDVDADTRRAVEDALGTVRGLGAEIVALRFPDVKAMLDDWGPACAVETAVAHEPTYPSRRAAYGPGLAGLIDAGPRALGARAAAHPAAPHGLYRPRPCGARAVRRDADSGAAVRRTDGRADGDARPASRPSCAR